MKYKVRVDNRPSLIVEAGDAWNACVIAKTMLPKGARIRCAEPARVEKRTIWVKPSCFVPEFEMIIPVPDDVDDERYIDELLGSILRTEFRYSAEWDFADGLS